MLDPWRLRTLRELAARGTMAAAAEALQMTPSAVSQQLTALERQAGAALTEPSGRGVRLTPAGRALAAHAEVILAAMQEAQNEVTDLSRDFIGTLRVASFPSVAIALFPTVTERLRQAYPKHRISFFDQEPPGSVGSLIRGEVDIAIVDALALPEDPDLAGRIEYSPVLTDPVYCVLPEGHPAASREAIDLRELRHERWVIEKTTSSFHSLVMGLFTAAGYQPDIFAICRSADLQIALARGRCGLAILPRLAVWGAGARGVVTRPLVPPTSRRVFAAYRRGGPSRAVLRTAVKLLVEAAADLPAGQQSETDA